MVKPESLEILRSLHAEEMLNTWSVFRRLKAIPEEMTYKGVPFLDYFEQLQKDINAIGYLNLRSVVTLAEIPTYQIELSGSYERILDGINRCQIDAATMLGRCKTLRAKASSLKGPFQVLWTIGATEVIQGTSLGSVGAKTLEALANAEYIDVLNEADSELDAMVEALSLTISSLKMFRKLASDKYAIGRDQINAALSELSNQDQGLLDRRGELHVQDPGRSSLPAIFGHRLMQEVGPLVEEDDLPPDAPVEAPPVKSQEEVPTVSAPPAPQEVKAPAPVVEAPKPPKKKSHHKAKNSAPEAPEAESPAVPMTLPPEAVKAVLDDPFLGKDMAEVVIQEAEAQKQAMDDAHAMEDDLPPMDAQEPPMDVVVPPEEDDLPPMGAQVPPEEDDLPSDVPMSSEESTLPPTEDEEDLSFLASAPVVDRTPATKELADMAGSVPASNEDPLAPASAVKQSEPPAKAVEPPAAPKAEETQPAAVRPRNGLFRSKSNLPMAPAFTRPPKAPENPSDMQEFM